MTAQDAAAGPTETQTVEVTLSAFAIDQLRAEAQREGVTLGELIAHAAMYFLADANSGRISRRFPRAARSS